MSTQYPTNLDTFQNPLAVDLLSNPSHAAQHSDANDAIEAIQALIGVLGSTSSLTILGQLAAKANAVHNHDASYAPIAHGHNTTDVAGLETRLAALESNAASIDLKADKTQFHISTTPPSPSDGADGDWWAVVS